MSLLAYDFDTFVGGHLTSIGTKQDVAITKQFTMDVYNTVKGIHNNIDQAAVMSEAAKTIGTDNEFLLFKAIPAVGNSIMGNDTSCPQSWSENRFDLVWVFDQDVGSGEWSFHQVSQRLLAGDSCAT